MSNLDANLIWDRGLNATILSMAATLPKDYAKVEPNYLFNPWETYRRDGRPTVATRRPEDSIFGDAEVHELFTALRYHDMFRDETRLAAHRNHAPEICGIMHIISARPILAHILDRHGEPSDWAPPPGQAHHISYRYGAAVLLQVVTDAALEIVANTPGLSDEYIGREITLKSIESAFQGSATWENIRDSGLRLLNRMQEVRERVIREQGGRTIH